ncbi:hypothetical protein PIB30_001577 [Stylosanthes scabra]|uniref:Uncharacterized protein n=1 Tax=Stylosanthes scabra TaxID=79078 RepID=A0ABU6S2Y1_9FABA|nr:hypothetical protein [Stylosanthes scabra]
MGHDDRTGFFFSEWFMALDRFNPLRRIGLATDQVSVLSDLCHCQAGWTSSSLSFSLILLDTMRPTAPRPPRPVGSPSSSVSSGSSGSFHRERERSPRTPLPPPAPLHAPGPVYPIPRTSMMDVRRYRSLFSRRRVAPPTPPYPSPPRSDEEPSEGTVDLTTELEGDPDEPYHEDIVYPAGYEAYSSDTSYGSERESVSASSAPSSRHSSDDSSASRSIGYGEASSGSVSDCALDDDLVNRHFAGTFP